MLVDPVLIRVGAGANGVACGIALPTEAVVSIDPGSRLLSEAKDMFGSGKVFPGSVGVVRRSLVPVRVSSILELEPSFDPRMFIGAVVGGNGVKSCSSISDPLAIFTPADTGFSSGGGGLNSKCAGQQLVPIVVEGQ